MTAPDEAAAFPALAAIFSRRSRRFPLGGSLTGPLAYTSDAKPLPLSEEEEAILVAAATGVTGIIREEWLFLDAGGQPTGGDKLASFTGRTYPSPLASKSTEVFWTNDAGTYLLPQRDVRAGSYTENQSPADHGMLRGTAARLSAERLEIPRRQPNLFAFNHQLINVPGSTVFIPIADMTRQCITAMLLYFDRPHGYYLVDCGLGGDPLRPFVASGLLSDAHPVDLADFERWQMVDANGVESGLVVANLATATQALGLGGHPFSGGKGRVIMGGERHWHAIGGTGPASGLGFRFHRVPDGAPARPLPHDFSPAHIRAGLERSLRLLRTDHLDLLQLHMSPSLATIQADHAVKTLQSLRDEGKVRFIGSSSTIPHLWDLLDLEVFDAFQIPYSALERDHEVAITEAHQRGAGVIIRGGVAKGGPRPDRPQFKNVWEAWDAAGLGQLLEAGQSPVEFVLRFTLAQPGLSTIIVGTASVGHLQDNMARALQGPLPADVYQEARQRLDAVGVAPLRRDQAA